MKLCDNSSRLYAYEWRILYQFDYLQHIVRDEEMTVCVTLTV